MASTINNYNPNRFLGEPCVHGHDGWRYVRSRDCCECTRLRAKRHRQQGKRATVDGVGRYFRGEQAHGTKAVQGGADS